MHVFVFITLSAIKQEDDGEFTHKMDIFDTVVSFQHSSH